MSEIALWPELPLAAWKDTCDTLHLWTQIVGKVRIATTPLDPRIEPERKAAGDYTNSRAVIDACRPFHWRDTFPAVNMPSPEQRREALHKFGHLMKS